MFKEMYKKCWTIIDPGLYTLGACGSFGLWISVF